MPLFELTDTLVFPDPDRALAEGLLAIGGDLSRDRLLVAYANGIFPWFGENEPILWWSPDPRMVLFLDDFHVSRRLERRLKSPRWRVTFDTKFEHVIDACAGVPRRDQDGTWITREMRHAYVELHHAGYAHSVEAWYDGNLVGGVYGVSMGRCFFGESMFSLRTDASKVAFATLVNRLREWEFNWMDCQVYTPHLERLGARDVPRREFLDLLRRDLNWPTHRGLWTEQETE